MRKKRVGLGSMVLGVVLVLGFFAGEVLAEENLLKNPGFEKSASKAANWSTKSRWYEKPKGSGISRVVIDTSIAHSGRNSLKIKGEDNRAFVQQRIPVKANCRYEISGWIKTADLSSMAVIGVVEHKVLPKKTLKFKGRIVGKVGSTTTWKQFIFKLFTGPEINHIVVNLYTLEANNGTVWFDDISVVEIGEGEILVKKEDEVKEKIVKKGNMVLERVKRPVELKEMPDLQRVLFLENSYELAGKWIVEIPLIRLDIPEEMKIAAITAQEQGTLKKIQVQIEDDNLNSRIEREDLLLLEIEMEEDEIEKAVLINISSKPKAEKKTSSSVKVQEHTFYYEVKTGKVLAEFSQKNGALNSLKYNGKNVITKPIGYRASTGVGMGGESTTKQPNQAAAELKVGLQEGPLRARIDFSGNKNLRGYWTIYPDSKIEYTLILSPKRPDDMLTSCSLEIDKNYLGEYHLHYSADSKGISGKSFSIDKTPRVITDWGKGAVIQPHLGPLLGLYSLKQNTGIALIRNLKEEIKINWPPLRIHDYGNRVFLSCYINRRKIDTKNPEVKRTYIRFFTNASQLQNIVAMTLKTPEIFTEKEYLSCLRKRIAETKKMISFLLEFEESRSGVNELENALAEKELSQEALLEISKKQMGLEKALTEKAANEIPALKSSIQTLKRDGLLYQPVQVDIDKAEVYFRTADLYSKRNKRLSYQCKGIKLLIQAKEKLRVIKKSRIPDSLKGKEGSLKIAVSWRDKPQGLNTLKALGLKYGGNNGFGRKYIQDKEYDFYQLDNIFNYYDEYGLESMMAFFYQARSKSFMKHFPEFKDEIEVTAITTGVGASKPRFIMASPDMIPLKWTAMQKKLIQSFVRRYKSRKSVLTWDPWGETWFDFGFQHPLITKAYREFLREKYEKTGRLNKVWSQDLVEYNYAEFEEITPPEAKEIRKHSWRIMDWHLFSTKRYSEYIAWVTGIIKEVDPVHPIKLVETSGMYPGYGCQLDSYALAHAGANYKGAGIDTYPASNDRKHPWQEIANRIDSKRSANNGVDVWVGETGHWNDRTKLSVEACSHPEEMREWVYTYFLHGAKFISFFCWQTGIRDWSLMELDTTPTENAIAVGLVNCEANNLKPLWSAKQERTAAIYYPRLSAMHGKSNREEMRGLHKILIELGFGVDPIDSEILKKRLNQYKLLVLPPSPYMYDDVEKEIISFVKQGGTVICSSETASGIYNRIGEPKESPAELAKLISQGMKLKNPVYSGNVESISSRGKGNVVVMTKGIGRRYRNRRDVEQIRKGLLHLLTENNIYPAASPDKDEIESAVISNGKSKYLLIINHRHKAVQCKITIYDSVAEKFGNSPQILYNIHTLNPVMVQKKGAFWQLATELEPMGVQIFPLAVR